MFNKKIVMNSKSSQKLLLLINKINLTYLQIIFNINNQQKNLQKHKHPTNENINSNKPHTPPCSQSIETLPDHQYQKHQKTHQHQQKRASVFGPQSLGHT